MVSPILSTTSEGPRGSGPGPPDARSQTLVVVGLRLFLFEEDENQVSSLRKSLGYLSDLASKRRDVDPNTFRDFKKL